MKAVLLAAGSGTRLRPITDHTPKCLVDIKKRPLLHWWIELLTLHGITEVLINTHYLREKVEDYVENIRHTTDLKSTLSYESELLGSVGTLLHNGDYLKGEKCALVAYADNYTNTNLSRFIAGHLERYYPLSVGLFHAPDPRSAGIVTLSETDVITAFTKKPQNPTSDLANAGISCIDFNLISSKYSVLQA